MNAHVDGPGLSAWDLAYQRVQFEDVARREWLDKQAAMERETECQYCGAPLDASNGSGCCQANACRAARKREIHAACAGSGERCTCGCGRVRTKVTTGTCVCGCGAQLLSNNASGYASYCKEGNRIRMATYRARDKARRESAKAGWETRRAMEGA